VSTNSGRSKHATITRLLRQASLAEAAGRLGEAATLLQEVVRLDPRDQRILHRMGDFQRTRLNRPDRAASWYAREAHELDLDGATTRAIAAWRLVIRCDPRVLEPYERIGSLYAALGRTADAKLHYETSAQEFQAQGRRAEAAILRAQLAALEPEQETPPGAPAESLAAGEWPAAPVIPDAEALALAAEREQDARLYFQHGLHPEARRYLEDVIAILPEHVGARQFLVEVCRTLHDDEAAAEHLRVLTELLQRQSGAAADTAADTATDTTTDTTPPEGIARADEPWELPPFEQWDLPKVRTDSESPAKGRAVCRPPSAEPEAGS
jgi:tetratricopeptide (TPR) repeat protein